MIKFLNQLLCGFLKAHSTQHALFRLIQSKLEAYGLAKENLQLISDFLSYCKQRTKIISAYSDWANIICHLLFNIFINCIFHLVEKPDTCNFADDNTLFSHGSNLPLILNNFEHDMKNLLYWFNSPRQTQESSSLRYLRKRIV